MLNKEMNKEVNSQMQYKSPATQASTSRSGNERWGRRVPRLDAALGFALLRDRRVDRAQKLRALLVGGAVVAGVIAMTAVNALIMGITGPALNVVDYGL